MNCNQLKVEKLPKNLADIVVNRCKKWNQVVKDHKKNFTNIQKQNDHISIEIRRISEELKQLKGDK